MSPPGFEPGSPGNFFLFSTEIDSGRYLFTKGHATLSKSRAWHAACSSLSLRSLARETPRTNQGPTWGTYRAARWTPSSSILICGTNLSSAAAASRCGITSRSTSRTPFSAGGPPLQNGFSVSGGGSGILARRGSCSSVTGRPVLRGTTCSPSGTWISRLVSCIHAN